MDKGFDVGSAICTASDIAFITFGSGDPQSIVGEYG